MVEGDRVTDVRLHDQRVRAPGPDERTKVQGNSNAHSNAHSPVVSDVAGHCRLLEDFADAVLAGGRPACDGAEGRRSVALVEAIYLAAARGTAVSL